LRDAAVLSDELVKVDVCQPINIKMKGEMFNLEKGVIDIPTYLAIF